MADTTTRLEAFLKDEAEWYLQYAELCREVSVSLTPRARGRNWHSRADASYRRAQSCLERLGTLRKSQNPNPSL